MAVTSLKVRALYSPIVPNKNMRIKGSPKPVKVKRVK